MQVLGTSPLAMACLQSMTLAAAVAAAAAAAAASVNTECICQEALAALLPGTGCCNCKVPHVPVAWYAWILLLPDPGNCCCSWRLCC
jgi:hypothetical protein